MRDLDMIVARHVVAEHAQWCRENGMSAIDAAVSIGAPRSCGLQWAAVIECLALHWLRLDAGGVRVAA